jgi:chromate transporter
VSTEPGSPTTHSGDLVPVWQALWAWLMISLQTFGGPAGLIAVMQRIPANEKRWTGQKRFLHALN